MNNLEVVQGKVFDIIGVADAVIAQMAEKYLPLKINGIEDKAGYKAVHDARMVVKSTRVKVEKHGKEMREEAVKYQKAVIAEEKRIIGLMEPIETHLTAEEKAVDDALEAIKQEAARKEAERIQKRIDRLEVDFGMGLFGQNYKLPFDAPGTEFPATLVKTVGDEQFEKMVWAIEEAWEKENARKVEIEKERIAKEERLAKIAAEQEAERQRLEAVAQAQEAEERKRRIQEKLEQEERERKEAEIRAEAKRIADEKAEWQRIKAEEIRAQEAAKQKIIDDERHAKEIKKAREETAAQVRLQAEEDAKKAEADRIAKESLAKIKEEKRLARLPDKQALLLFIRSDAASVRELPKLKTDEYKAILEEYQSELALLIQRFIDRTEAL